MGCGFESLTLVINQFLLKKYNDSGTNDKATKMDTWGKTCSIRTDLVKMFISLNVN